MLLNDFRIERLCSGPHAMISPFISTPTREVDGKKVISFGASSFGQDVRLAPEYKIFTNQYNAIVDPKEFDPNCFVTAAGPTCLIPPNSFILARTIEYFQIPGNILGIVFPKSTIARCGIVVSTTVLEPSWSGYLTLEIANTTPLPARVYANEGIAQICFLQSEEPRFNYANRPSGAGKYQSQGAEIVLPRL